MCQWNKLLHPFPLWLLSSRNGCIVVGLINLGLVIWAGLTRHYGFTSWDSFFSFELMYANARYHPQVVGHNCGVATDTLSACAVTASNWAHNVLVICHPYYVNAYPSYLLLLFVCNGGLILSAFWYRQGPVFFWIVVKIISILVNLMGTIAHFVDRSNDVIPHEDMWTHVMPLATGLLLKWYSLWIAWDFFCLLETVDKMSIEEILSLVPAMISKSESQCLS